MAARVLSTALLVATAVLAKTDLEDCTYYDSVVDPGYYAPYATRVWYLPDTGEICEFLDCGGGRAPPKTTVPGCGAYEGTATYSPRFLDLKTLGGNAPQTTAAPTSSSEEASEPRTTEAPASSSAESDDEVDETSTSASASASASESTDSPVASETSASVSAPIRATNSAVTTPAPGTKTSTESQDVNATPSASTSTSSSDIPGAAAALPTGAVLGSWAMAGVAVWVGMM